jgi:glycyl-tRNA synthetase
MPAASLDVLVSLAKRRGFVFGGSEIYGGIGGFWDYGPLGVELRNNIKAAWWRSLVRLRDDIEGIDAAIIMNPRVWEASGHVAGFSDPMVDCRNCKHRFRESDLKGPPSEIACPDCGQRGTLTDARQFNLMFKTHVGPVEEDASVAYLRPETAQGIFVNFKNVQTTTRKKPPFGVAQIGKSFRNEITPGNFIFRTREFEQMEMEFFVPPDDAARWYEYWCQERFRWFVELGIPETKLRLRAHDADELSHYSAGTSDVEFAFPWGWGELEGIANRADYDLTQHAKHSGEDLSFYDQETDTRYVPHVIEPALGADRATLAFLLAAYEEEEVPNGKGGTETRTVLRLHPRLAPIGVAVLPLSKNDRLVPVADEVAGLLRPHFMIDVDVTGSIGRRYRRQDEVGTPLCVTVDFDTLDDRAVTIRDRDTMEQARVPIEALRAELDERLSR